MKVISWLSIISGYLLMIGMIYLVYKILKIYLFDQEIVRAIGVPPLMPLIPYIDKMVPGLPNFYFFYWIVIIIIIAIPHEFAHGIVAAYNKVKIKTTGFGFFPSFLPIFLAAFVELDEKAMAKKSKFKQMATLSAGTFANVVFAFVLLGILWLIFPLLFTSSGIIFDSYQLSILNSSQIQTIDGEQISFANYETLLEKTKETGLTEITVLNKTYLLDKDLILKEGYKEILEQGYVIVYEDAPAINARLNGTITEINGEKISDMEELQKKMVKYSPGDKIIISTLLNQSEKEYEIVLGENPNNKTEPWLGLAVTNVEQKPLTKFFSKIIGFKDANTSYVSRLGEFSMFIYNLFWWATLICFSVALVNMLPVGLFDGGRFFYLTIFALTGSEKNAKRTFSFLTYFFLFLMALLMVLWATSFL
ncbi:MAG: site-2 protease family protein [archaeon]